MTSPYAEPAGSTPGTGSEAAEAPGRIRHAVAWRILTPALV